MKKSCVKELLASIKEMMTKKKTLFLLCITFLLVMSFGFSTYAAEEPVYLIDSIAMNNGQNGITSGWDYDNRYQIFNKDGSVTYTLCDSNETDELSLKRKISPQSSGVMTLEMVVTLSNAENGAFFLFTDENGEDTFKLYTKNGFFCTMGYSETQLPYVYNNGNYKVKLIMDLDTRLAQVYLNGVDCGTVGMSEESTEINKFIIGTTKENSLTITPTWVQLYVNYLINDGFFMSPLDSIPVDWNVSGNMTIKANYSSSKN